MIITLIERLNNDDTLDIFDRELKKDAVLASWSMYGERILKLEKKQRKKNDAIRFVTLVGLYGFFRYAYEEGIVHTRDTPYDPDWYKKGFDFLRDLYKATVERIKKQN